MKSIQRAAYLASTGLASEKGSFPLFDKEKYLATEAIRNLDDDVRQAIADRGIRNALLTSIAPTGTISLFADNVSSGLEPVFSFKYNRHIIRIISITTICCICNTQFFSQLMMLFFVKNFSP